MSRIATISALGVAQILAWGSSYYLLAVLAAPVAAETGWPVPWIVGALSVGLLTAGLVSPLVGRAIGASGGRPVLALSAVLLAGGQIILGTAPSLIVFMLGWVVLGLGMGAGLYDATFATLGRLYGTSARSAITTLTLWGGFASTVCWPLSAWLVAAFGWRGTSFAYAAIELGIALPLILWAVPAGSSVPQATNTPASGAAPRRSERYGLWLLAGIIAVHGTVTAIVSVHLLALLQTRDLSVAEAVAIGALIGPAQVAGRIVEMAGRGRHHPIWSLCCAVALVAAGLSFLWFGIAPAAALVLYGAGNGVFSIARGTLPLAMVGPDRYAPLMGRLARPALVAQAISPLAGALVLEHAGPTSAWSAIAILAVSNVALVSVLWWGTMAVLRRRIAGSVR